MRDIYEWTERLAQDISPIAEDECESVAETVKAFLGGKEDRATLFAGRGRQRRGDLVQATVVLPYMLQSISVAGAALLAVLSSQALADFTTVVHHTLSIREFTGHPETSGKGDETKHGVKSVSHESPGVGIPGGEPYAPLRRVNEVMVKELSRSGLSVDQSEMITFHVLSALLEDPSGAKEYVHALCSTDYSDRPD